jgi:hypothetical protein
MKQHMRRILTIILFSGCLLPLSAQHVEELYSPWFFGLGPVITVLDAPVGTVLNPAAAALEQRTRLELNYFGIPDLMNNSGWGHAANLGVSLPTNFGVLSLNGHFQSLPTAVNNTGTLGGINIAFSKDLYANFHIGAGIGSSINTRFGVTDWSLGGDLGIIHQLGKVAFLQDFTWALTIRAMGKGISPVSGIDPLPQPFTPAMPWVFPLRPSRPIPSPGRSTVTSAFPISIRWFSMPEHKLICSTRC